MDLKAFIRGSMNRARDYTLRSIQGLGEEEYRWYPGPEANPICFLLFHIARSEDSSFSRISGPQTAQVWGREGLDLKYSLPADGTPRAVGGWTSQEVRAFRYPPLEELLRYLEAIRAGAVNVLEELNLGRLEEPSNPDRPETTIAASLWSGPIHEASHRGAIEYLRGLYQNR